MRTRLFCKESLLLRHAVLCNAPSPVFYKIKINIKFGGLLVKCGEAYPIKCGEALHNRYSMSLHIKHSVSFHIKRSGSLHNKRSGSFHNKRSGPFTTKAACPFRYAAFVLIGIASAYLLR